MVTVGQSAFYKAKDIRKIEWWLSDCSEYPHFLWARLRVFTDGSADAAFKESKVFGFENEKYAGYFLSEDEYIRYESMDEEDEVFIGVKKSQIFPPSWNNCTQSEFEYLGTY